MKETWKNVLGVVESPGIYVSKRVKTLVEVELMLRKLLLLVVTVYRLGYCIPALTTLLILLPISTFL